MPVRVFPPWWYTIRYLWSVIYTLQALDIPVMDKKITMVEWCRQSDVPLYAWMVEEVTGLPAGSL